LMIQDAGPWPSEVMNELGRRGADALPDLIAHLEDGRKTGATIKAMASGIRYSAEYEWNSRTSKIRPVGTVDPHARGSRLNVAILDDRADGKEYVVMVGDLCFNIIGQIVNRRFLAVRYQPTAIIVVNSPVLCADLRNAVRAEWGHITHEQIRDSLISDAATPAAAAQATGALAMLSKMYPDALVAAARERLKTPVYDEGKIRSFVLNTLYITVDPAERLKLINDFVARNGPAYRDGLLLQVWGDRNHRAGDKMVGGPRTDSIPRPRISPREVLLQIAPDSDLERRPVVQSVEGRETSGYIDAIGKLSMPEMDQLIWEEFKKRSVSHAPALGSDTDGIAMACIRILIHRNHDAEFIVYSRRRLAELPEIDETGSTSDSRRSFRSFVDFVSAPTPGQ